MSASKRNQSKAATASKRRSTRAPDDPETGKSVPESDENEATALSGEGDEEEVVEEVIPEVIDALPVADDEEVLADDEVDEGAESTVPARLDVPPVPTTRSLAKYDPLTAYIQETRRYPLLSREEEHELAVAYKEHGDLDAARRLVTANLRLVVKIAHEYRKAYQNLLDLIQEGNVGLVQAVQKYDPYRGVKLSTYAAWWIKAYILKFILNNWRMVKIGTTQAQRKLFFNLRKQREELERRGIQPTAERIADALDVTENEVVEMERRLAAPDLSLSTPLDKGDAGSRTYYDVLPEDKAPPDEQVASAQFREMLRRKLDAFAQTLTGRDEVIYKERLMSETPLTLKEIGDRYGVSRERARQLEKRLLGRLRDYLRQEMGDAVEIAMGWER